MKFFIKDFFSKSDQIRNFLRIWSHLMKKSLMENFIFCAVPFANPKIWKIQFWDTKIYLAQSVSNLVFLESSLNTLSKNSGD